MPSYTPSGWGSVMLTMPTMPVDNLAQQPLGLIRNLQPPPQDPEPTMSAVDPTFTSQQPFIDARNGNPELMGPLQSRARLTYSGPNPVPRSARASNRGGRAASRGSTSTSADDMGTRVTHPTHRDSSVNTITYWRGSAIFQDSRADVVKRALKRPYDVVYTNDLIDAIDKAIDNYIVKHSAQPG
jgi:hypothetical protein